MPSIYRLAAVTSTGRYLRQHKSSTFSARYSLRWRSSLPATGSTVRRRRRTTKPTARFDASARHSSVVRQCPNGPCSRRPLIKEFLPFSTISRWKVAPGAVACADEALVSQIIRCWRRTHRVPGCPQERGASREAGPSKTPPSTSYGARRARSGNFAHGFFFFFFF
jgi:hypothetical protein